MLALAVIVVVLPTLILILVLRAVLTCVIIFVEFCMNFRLVLVSVEVLIS